MATELTPEMSEEVINLATGLSEMCLVPQLKLDFTMVAPSEDDFKQFRVWLSENLPLLFSVFHKNESVLLESSNANLTFRINFVMIICEQSSSCDFFQIENEQISKNLNNLSNNYLYKYFFSDDHFLFNVFNAYKTKLNKDSWKTNIASLYGFLRFCELLYEEPATECDESIRYTDRCMFILALATNLSEHYDPIYKTIGIKLFNILLDKMNHKTIEKINIHEVIYSTVFPNIEKIKEENLNLLLWNCLYSCVKFTKITDPAKWNKLDDLFSGITKKILLESNQQIKIKLLFYMAKLSAIAIHDNDVVNQAVEFDYVEQQIEDGNMEFNFEDMRQRCKQYRSFFTYRWVKTFLSLYITTANEMLCSDRKSVLLFLHIIHVSYLIAIYSIPPNLIEHQLNEFTRRFCESAKLNMVTNKNDRDIKKMMLSLINTIARHRSLEEKNDTTNKFDEDIQLIEKIVNSELTL